MNLLERIQAFDVTTLTGSADKVQSGETVVGDMSDFLRRLYCILTAAGSKADALVDVYNNKARQHQAGHRQHGGYPPACCETHNTEMRAQRAEHDRAKAEFENLHQIFWAAAKLEFPELEGKQMMFVREGFKVAWCDEKAEDQFRLTLSLLGHFLRAQPL